MKIFIAHQKTAPFYKKGDLFDVGSHELEKNIGKKCKFIHPSCGVQHEIFTIVHLQKDHKGDVIYRGTCESDTGNFGYPINPDDVEII